MLDFLISNASTLSLCVSVITAAWKVAKEGVLLRSSVDGLMREMRDMRVELAAERDKREAADELLHRRVDSIRSFNGKEA